MKLFIVESPAKARKIGSFLGSGYKVKASVGHVTAIPPRGCSCRPDEGFTYDASPYRGAYCSPRNRFPTPCRDKGLYDDGPGKSKHSRFLPTGLPERFPECVPMARISWVFYDSRIPPKSGKPP